MVLKKMCSSYIHVGLSARRNSQFSMHQTEQTYILQYNKGGHMMVGLARHVAAMHNGDHNI